MRQLKFELGNTGVAIAVAVLLAGGFFLGKATAQKPSVCVSATK